MDREAISRAVDKARQALRRASTPAERENIRSDLRALQQRSESKAPALRSKRTADPSRPYVPGDEWYDSPIPWVREAVAEADRSAHEDWQAWQRGERLPIQGALLRGGE